VSTISISQLERGFATEPVNRVIVPWGSTDRRCERVAGVLLAVLILSVLDLALTLGCMMQGGMFEANPIVVHLAQSTQSPAIIGLFKVSTVLVGASMLFRLRRHPQAELAAWLIAIILAAVAFQWIQYLTLASGLPIVMSHDPAWIQLP